MQESHNNIVHQRAHHNDRQKGTPEWPTESQNLTKCDKKRQNVIKYGKMYQTAIKCDKIWQQFSLV